MSEKETPNLGKVLHFRMYRILEKQIILQMLNVLVKCTRN
jgi:hypothetical protein